MRRVYIVIVGLDKKEGYPYKLYAPSYSAPLVPKGVDSSTHGVEAFLRGQGFNVMHRVSIKMEDDSVVECFSANQPIDGAYWRTSLEIANRAPERNARIFLASLSWVVSQRR